MVNGAHDANEGPWTTRAMVTSQFGRTSLSRRLASGFHVFGDEALIAVHQLQDAVRRHLCYCHLRPCNGTLDGCPVCIGSRSPDDAESRGSPHRQLRGDAPRSGGVQTQSTTLHMSERAPRFGELPLQSITLSDERCKK
jgi:hypothetical protein